MSVKAILDKAEVALLEECDKWGMTKDHALLLHEFRKDGDEFILPSSQERLAQDLVVNGLLRHVSHSDGDYYVATSRGRIAIPHARDFKP